MEANRQTAKRWGSLNHTEISLSLSHLSTHDQTIINGITKIIAGYSEDLYGNASEEKYKSIVALIIQRVNTLLKDKFDVFSNIEFDEFKTAIRDSLANLLNISPNDTNIELDDFQINRLCNDIHVGVLEKVLAKLSEFKEKLKPIIISSGQTKPQDVESEENTAAPTEKSLDEKLDCVEVMLNQRISRLIKLSNKFLDSNEIVLPHKIARLINYTESKVAQYIKKLDAIVSTCYDNIGNIFNGATKKLEKFFNTIFIGASKMMLLVFKTIFLNPNSFVVIIGILLLKFISGFIGNSLNVISDKITAGFDKITEFIVAGLDILAPVIDFVLNVIGPPLKFLLDICADIIITVIRTLDPILPSLIKVLTDFCSLVINVLVKILKPLASCAYTIGSFLSTIGLTLFNILGTLLKGIKPIAKDLGVLIACFVEAAVDIMIKIAKVLKPIAYVFGLAIASTIALTVKFINFFLSGLETSMIEQFGEMVGSVILLLAKYIGDIISMVNGDLSDGIKRLDETIKDGVKRGRDYMFGLGFYIGQICINVLDHITSFMKHIVGDAVKFSTYFANDLKIKLTQYDIFLHKFFSKFLDDNKATTDMTKQAASIRLLNEAFKFITNFNDNIVSKLETKINMLTSLFNVVYTNIFKLGILFKIFYGQFFGTKIKYGIYSVPEIMEFLEDFSRSLAYNVDEYTKPSSNSISVAEFSSNELKSLEQISKQTTISKQTLNDVKLYGETNAHKIRTSLINVSWWVDALTNSTASYSNKTEQIYDSMISCVEAI